MDGLRVPGKDSPLLMGVNYFLELPLKETERIGDSQEQWSAQHRVGMPHERQARMLQTELVCKEETTVIKEAALQQQGKTIWFQCWTPIKYKMIRSSLVHRG